MSHETPNVPDTSLTERTPSIFSLPIELLQVILEIFLNGAFCGVEWNDQGIGRRVTAATARTKLQLVCKHWNSAILACPQLWTYLELGHTHPTDVQRAVKLSGEATLSIDAGLYRTSLRSGRTDIAEACEAERLLLVELLGAEAHRIGSLGITTPMSVDLATQGELGPIALSSDAVSLRGLHIELGPQAAVTPHPFWMPVLTRAPHLESLRLQGEDNHPFWATFAAAASFPRLRYLTLQHLNTFPLLDFVSLIRRLPDLEVIFVTYFGFSIEPVDNVTGAILEKAPDIELPRLRSILMQSGNNKILHFISKLVLPPLVNIRLPNISISQPEDVAVLLRAVRRIAASISAESMNALTLQLSDYSVELCGPRPEVARPPHRHILKLLRSICENFSFERARSLTLELHHDHTYSARTNLEELRPVLVRMERIEEVHLDDNLTEVNMSSLESLLLNVDGAPVYLPRLTSLRFSTYNLPSWCSTCASQFMSDLGAMLRTLHTSGREISSVLVKGPSELHATGAAEDIVRALVAEFTKEVPLHMAGRDENHRCLYRKEDNER
ncbi:hypothetical protein PsYK624_163750 [Phanerochaete sordida]|uniref:F-box domain-containing protein n=1 Tax=Phanerochaete sordida TaxID=48140 RepID=A0A9P3GVS1_9APHY|nr:hypothetical protein PsYK624_163750 [Phanerochaete sordida]